MYQLVEFLVVLRMLEVVCRRGQFLRPLLFLLYINYMPYYLKIKCIFFADDIKVYLRIRGDSFVNRACDLSLVQRDLETIRRVSESWGLQLNSQKCVLIRFQRGTFDWESVGSLQHYYVHSLELTQRFTAILGF